jgi:glutamyl-tRNA reductase
LETLDCDPPTTSLRNGRAQPLCDQSLAAAEPLASASDFPSDDELSPMSESSSESASIACLLVIGAGKTAESIAACLRQYRPQRLIVANRTMLNAQFLADRLGGVAVSLDDVPDYMAQADMVVSCTASEQPILSRALVEEALRIRHHKPLFLVDVAERGDFEATVRNIQDVFFATRTDLDFRASSDLPDEESAGRQAQAILQWQVQRYQAWRKYLGSHASLEKLKKSATEQRDRALNKACQLLKAGRAPGEALEYLAHALTNKFMHAPSASLRAASLRGDVALMQAAERLFGPIGSGA